MKQVFMIDHCTSCGKRIYSNEEEGKDYHAETEKDGSDNYIICNPCKTKWDQEDTKTSD